MAKYRGSGFSVDVRRRSLQPQAVTLLMVIWRTLRTSSR